MQCVFSGDPNHGVTGSAVPAGVPAAVAEAGDMPDEDLVGAEGVSVRASQQRVGNPLPAIVCTSSPSTTTSLFRPKGAKLGPATCRILGSALAAGVPRVGATHLLGVPGIHGLMASRCRMSSAWRCVSVLANRCCKWVRTVHGETDNSSEICLRSSPRVRRRAISASVLVRL